MGIFHIVSVKENTLGNRKFSKIKTFFLNLFQSKKEKKQGGEPCFFLTEEAGEHLESTKTDAVAVLGDHKERRPVIRRALLCHRLTEGRGDAK